VRLSHDHVVRDFSSSAIANGTVAHAAVEWRLPKEAGHSPAVVAFVQDTSNGDVLQALSLPLTRCPR
jgi:hypothetical protein